MFRVNDERRGNDFGEVAMLITVSSRYVNLAFQPLGAGWTFFPTRATSAPYTGAEWTDRPETELTSGDHRWRRVNSTHSDVSVLAASGGAPRRGTTGTPIALMMPCLMLIARTGGVEGRYFSYAPVSGQSGSGVVESTLSGCGWHCDSVEVRGVRSSPDNWENRDGRDTSDVEVVEDGSGSGRYTGTASVGTASGGGAAERAEMLIAPRSETPFGP